MCVVRIDHYAFAAVVLRIARTEYREDRVIDGGRDIEYVALRVVGESSRAYDQCRGIAAMRINRGDLRRAVEMNDVVVDAHSEAHERPVEHVRYEHLRMVALIEDRQIPRSVDLRHRRRPLRDDAAGSIQHQQHAGLDRIEGAIRGRYAADQHEAALENTKRGAQAKTGGTLEERDRLVVRHDLDDRRAGALRVLRVVEVRDQQGRCGDRAG